jgi:hypothetical protein
MKLANILKLSGAGLFLGGVVFYAVAQTIDNPVTLPNPIVSATCTDCTMNGTSAFTSPSTLDGIPLKASQTLRTNTTAGGTYTWTYPVAWGAGVVPVCQVTAENAAASTDIVNAQMDGPATNTQAKVKITRTSVVTILSINVLGLAANTATPINITCFTP